MMEAHAGWREFLSEILSSDDKHYLWLRTLSYLEFIGYRKMVKALNYQDVNRGVFHHLSDEIRHSFMLKDLAEKSFGGIYQHAHFDDRFIDLAENYFQELDTEIKTWVLEKSGEERPFLCYLLVSYLIEKRAMMVYPQYYARLQEAPLKVTLQKIIKDEKDHLAYIEDRTVLLPEMQEFSQSDIWSFEDGRFKGFLNNFRKCLA